MMNNKETAVYIILDAGTRVILGGPFSFEVATRVARSVLDVTLMAIGRKHWAELVRDTFDGATTINFSFRRGEATGYVPSAHDIQRGRKVELVASAFGRLLWFANHTVEGIWSTKTLEVGDLPLAVNSIAPFVDAYMRATGVDEEVAKSQVEFDRDSLLVTVSRRKEILYKFEAEAMAVENLADLEAFRERVYFDVISAGAV